MLQRLLAGLFGGMIRTLCRISSVLKSDVGVEVLFRVPGIHAGCLNETCAAPRLLLQRFAQGCGSGTDAVRSMASDCCPARLLRRKAPACCR